MIDAEAIVLVRNLIATTPLQGGRWTIRRLAKATGLSRASVHRIVRTSDTLKTDPRRRKRHTFEGSLGTSGLTG